MITLEDTPIPGLLVARSEVFADHRGAFARFFCEDELAPALGGRRIRQINFSRTGQAGSIRGLHFQKAPQAEMKMVRCLRGRVFDVALDLRHASPTFLKWHAIELDADSYRMMVIPEGCAHGFQTLEPDSELLYLHTAPYAPEHEGGVGYDDPAIKVAWPLPVSDISRRDLGHPLLDSGFTGLQL